MEFMVFRKKQNHLHRVNAIFKTHYLVITLILKDLGYTSFISSMSGEMINPFFKHFSLINGFTAFDEKLEVYSKESVGIAHKKQ